MKIHEIKLLIINQLREFWKVNLINTRYEVACYLIGYYGSISENYTEAINLLANEGYIKE